MWTSWKTSSFTTLLRLGTFRGYEPKLSSLCITFLVSYPARYCGNWRYSVPRIGCCFAMALRWKKPIPLKRLLVQKRSSTLAKHVYRKSLFLFTLRQHLESFYLIYFCLKTGMLCPCSGVPSTAPAMGTSYFSHDAGQGPCLPDSHRLSYIWDKTRPMKTTTLATKKKKSPEPPRTS